MAPDTKGCEIIYGHGSGFGGAALECCKPGVRLTNGVVAAGCPGNTRLMAFGADRNSVLTRG